MDQTHLLPANFQPDLIQVRATYTQRTQDTAKALLQGFFPNEFERIKIVVAPKNEDALLKGQKQPEHKKELQAIKANADQKFLTSQDDVYKQARQELAVVNKTFGTKLNSIGDLLDFADLLVVSKAHDKPLLKKLGQANVDKIISLKGELQRIHWDNIRVSCIYGKDFALHLAELLDARVSGQTQGPRYILYSGHDANIVATAFLLGSSTKVSTPYLSDLRFELFKNTKTNQTFVKVSLNDQPLKGCKSGTTCPTAEFVRTIRTNVERMCK